MDRPIDNPNKGQLTDDEFRILKAADEKMKGGRPTHTGWYRFRWGAYTNFTPCWVILDDYDDLRFFTFGGSTWNLVSSTTDDQWAGEIEMPK